jgi:hypothetical protein
MSEEHVNSLIKILKKVVKEWDFVTIMLVVVLFPWSLIWVGIRIVQEWPDEG